MKALLTDTGYLIALYGPGDHRRYVEKVRESFWTMFEQSKNVLVLTWPVLYETLVELGYYANKYERHGWHTSSLADDIVKFPLIVADARGHLLLQFLHWNDLDTNVDYIADIEGKMFHEQIVSNGEVFSQVELQRRRAV